MDTRKAIQVLNQRKVLVLASAAVLFVLLVAGSQLMSNTFYSTARLVVSPPAQFASTATGANQPVAADWMTNFTVLSTMMTSQHFLEQVIDSGKLDDPLATLRQELEVKEAPATSVGHTVILDVRITAMSPSTAKNTCAAVVDTFKDYVPALAAAEYTSNRRFLETLMTEAQSRLLKAENAVADWQQKHQSLDVSSSASTLAAAVNKLTVERDQAQQRVADLRFRVDQLKGYLAGSQPVPPWAVVDPSNTKVSVLEQSLSQETAKLAQYDILYTKAFPLRVQQQRIVRRLETLEKTETQGYVRSNLQEKDAQLRDAQSRLAMLQHQIDSLKRSWSLGKNNLEFQRLNREITTLHRNYEDAYIQWNNARIAEKEARREGAIQILEDPTPGIPNQGVITKDLRKSLPLILPVCVLFGVGVGLMSEHLAQSLRVRPQIEQMMEQPVIGVIPMMPKSYVQVWDRLRDVADAG